MTNAEIETKTEAISNTEIISPKSSIFTLNGEAPIFKIV